MTNNASVDIAVVGGGLVGTPLAIVLSQLGYSVALIDKQPWVDKQLIGDQHAQVQKRSLTEVAPKPGTRGFTAVSDSTVRTLKKHQLWDAVAHDACAIKQVHVSHKGYFGSTNINAMDEQVAALGYVVDNVQLLNAFQASVRSLAPTLQIIDNALVNSVKQGAANATIDYQIQQHTQQLSAKLLIAVDGVTSVLREASGIGVQQTDYDQVGILGTVSLSQSHEHIAYERFTPSGPLAMLPRPNNTASFVYCINPEMRDEVDAMDDQQFLAFLQEAFGYRLGRFSTVSERKFVPLLHIEAKQQTSDRLILLGNAFRLLHPVAGQGYNLAMRDVDALSSTLADAIQVAQHDNADVDPGDSALLQRFAQSRIADHKTVVRLTDTLARTFRGTASLPAHVRALSLITLDRLPVLRHRFARRSMGKL